MNQSILSRRFRTAMLMSTVVAGWLGGVAVSPCPAAIVAFLTDARPVVGERFESDLVLSGTSDVIGDQLEAINLDIFQSTVGGDPLTDFRRVRFEAAASFAAWHDGRQFGSGAEPSVIFLDAFANAPPVPFPIVDTNPFRVGTFTFDYGGLGLQVGDSVTLDIFGRDDGSATRTTALAVRPSGSAMTIQINPDFATPPGSARSVFTITVIPEPGSPIVLAMVCISVCARRRARRCGSSRFLWR